MGIKGISISRGFSRERWDKRGKERSNAHAAMEAGVSGREGQDENSAFRPSRRLNSTAAMSRALSADTERKIGLPDGHETDEAGISMGHISQTGYTLYSRPRREIALRFTRTHYCNTRKIMRGGARRARR